jgi:hypothetical protein
MDVFISYAREDSAHAERLYHALSSVPSVTPWLDSKKLLPGVRWKMEIMQALKTCDLFVILLSTKSVSKNGFIQKEVAEALEKLKTFPPDRVFVIPARLDDCHPKHPELHELQWVDLFPDWSEGFGLIVKTIQMFTGHTVETPSAPDDVVMETITTAEAFLRRLRVRGEMRGCDAMEIEFCDLPLSGVDLAGANFVRCQFTKCDFQDANLKGVNFEGAVFRECRLAGANLWGVNFWGADITGVLDFEKAALSHTNFFRTQATDAQDAFISANEDALSMGDYGTFVKYFSDDVGMGEDRVARTFAWLNHRYFRMMFGKNSDRIFRRKALYAIVDQRTPNKEPEATR